MKEVKCKISVICVSNDKSKFNEQLGASLKNQDADYELIYIDNSKNKFKSASEALNYGASISNGNILVFAHQDIYFKDSKQLSMFVDAVVGFPVGTICGAAGARELNKKNIGNYTSELEYDELFVNNIKKPEEVSCVDEFLLGMKKATYLSHPFDGTLCDNWHLYGVEQCLWARKNKSKVYVVPLQIHHFSHGTITLGYMNNLKKLARHYHNDFKYIWTTCYKVNTSSLYMNVLVTVWQLKHKLVGKRKLV